MFAYETGRKSLIKLANLYLFKVNNGNARTLCKVYPKFRGIFNPVENFSFSLLTILAKNAPS